MKNSKSRQHQVSSKLAKRLKRPRRLRRIESLETRAMLAGDVMSSWHNADMPADVNGDGQVTRLDVEILASEFAAGGSRKLNLAPQSGTLEGEHAIYLDVNNDGIFNSLDLLSSLNALSLEAEPASEDFQATFEFVITDTDGNVLANNGQTAEVRVGSSFRLQVFIRDTSVDPSGFTQAFVDIGFDSSYVTVSNPATAVDVGPFFESVSDSSFPTNVIPYGDRFEDLQQPDTLLWMGGVTLGGAIPANPDPVLLVDIEFQATAAGTFDFTTLRRDYPFNAEPNDNLIVSFNNVDSDGEITANENLVATYLAGAGADDEPFDIVNFVSGSVSVNVTAFDPDAIDDAYEIGEDFDPSAGDEDPALVSPPVVTIGGVQYAVLDVLANDRDGDDNTVAAPRTQFTIDSVSNNFGGRLTIQRDTQDVPELAALAGLSHEVLLYQVPENFSSPPTEDFTYTMTDTTSGSSDVGNVSITINPVDDPPSASDAMLNLEPGESVTFDVMTLASLQGGSSEDETLTFIEFVGVDSLVGNFVAHTDINGNETGQFTYTAPLSGQIESFQYVVSDGGTQTDTGQITVISNAEEYQATFEFVITDLDGNILALDGQTADIDLGSSFRLQVFVRDTSEDPSGFTQAFVDIGFDSSYVTIDDPATAVEHGPLLSIVPDNSFPTNVIPYGNRYAGLQQEDTLLWMGGLSGFASTPANDNPVLLVDIEFRASAVGQFDFTTLRRDYPFNSVPNDDLIVAFNNRDNNGNVLPGENLVATYLAGYGDDDEAFDVINFVEGMVSVNITFQPAAGANYDAYQVTEDFEGDDASSDPPLVTIDGQQYYVLDVLANDLDENLNPVPGDRSRFTIQSVTTPSEGGTVTIETDAQSVPEIVATGITSHQVLLYQVPANIGSPPPDTFEYTIRDSENNNQLSTAPVVVTITPVDDAPLAEDTVLTVDEGETITFDALSLASLQGGPDEDETLTFVEFVGEENLQGTFIPVLDGSGNPTGEFTYSSDIPGLIESVEYVVSDGGTQTATGTITFRTVLNSLLQGVVYFDADNDGVVDDNAHNNASPEMRIGGVTVELVQNGTVVDTTVTDAFGTYSFAQFDAGTYTVRISDPAFVRKGMTTAGDFTVNGNEISGIEIGLGGAGQVTGLNFGYRGRQAQYIGLADFLGSNTEESIVLALSKQNGQASLEWYSVDEGWDRLVRIRPEFVYYDPVTRNGQIAFEVSVEGQDEPQFVVQAFSGSTPGFIVVAETSEGVILRLNGPASSVLSNLAAVDAAFADM